MGKNIVLIAAGAVVFICLGVAAYFLLARGNKTPETPVSSTTETVVSDEKTYVPPDGKIETDGDIEPITKSPSGYDNLTMWYVTSARDADSTSEYCILYANDSKQIYSQWTRKYFGQEQTGSTLTYYQNDTVNQQDTDKIMQDTCWK